MPGTAPETDSLHSRTLSGVQDVIEHGLNYVNGLEMIIVRRAIQILQPRIEQRIREAPEEDLRTELKYLHDLLARILQEPSTKRPAKRKTKSRRKPRHLSSQ